jgi:putative phage-type endonuclease
MRTLPIIEARSGTDQWYAARRGLLTASRMGDATSFLKSGAPSKARTDLMLELVAERMTGIATTHFVTPAMQWGLDHEAEAISQFENKTGLLVEPAGLVIHPMIPGFGATPDGFVRMPDGKYALLEVKCPTTRTFLEWKLAGGVPEQHRAQMIAQMACCGALDSIFVAWDPRIADNKGLIIEAICVEPGDLSEVEEQAKTFLAKVEEIFEKVTQNG